MNKKLSQPHDAGIINHVKQDDVPMSIQEFTEKFMPEIIKNTFHADFIKWMDGKVKNLPNNTPILLQGGRSKSYHSMALKREVGIRVDNGFHLDKIIIDDGT